MRCQLICLLFISTFVVAFTALVPSDLYSYKEGQRYFLGLGKDGKPQLVDLEERDLTRKFTPDTDIVFYLYTRQNALSPQILINGDTQKLSDSFFDVKKPTKIIIHGWNNDKTSEVNTLITEAFLSKMDVNVIVMDWGAGAGGLYTTAVSNTPKSGLWLASFIDWLQYEGVKTSGIHLIGYSLGAHVAGVAGRYAQGVIAYISGLDPANPMWGASSERIRYSDAAYVEIIHTNAGNLGLKEELGHNDFYPNGGSGQPGCSFLAVACSHGRSYQFFADSIDHQGFTAKQCRTVNEATSNKCSNLSELYMGSASPKESRGIFYLETNAKQPYYQN